MEFYLAARFGPLAFRDATHTRRAPADRWTRSSPQHAPAAEMARLFPEGFLDAAFTLVRHPVDRLASVFRFQRDVERLLPGTAEFGDWLDGLEAARAADPHYLDNHVRPMTEMVPQGATVFRLEEGMDPVIAWLDDLAGGPAPDVPLRRRNDYAERLAWEGRDPGPAVVVSDAIRARIAARYAEDFARFGYDPAGWPPAEKEEMTG